MDYQLLNIIHARYKRMKKVTKKILTSILAAAMVLGMSVTAMAAEVAPVSVTNTTNKVTKTWNVAENGMLNDTEVFNFELKYAGAAKVGTNDFATPQYQNSDFSNKTAEVTTTWKTQANGGTTASASIDYTQLFSGITFSAPGIYSFNLKEIAGNNPNVSYSDSEYIIDVQVVWDGDEPGNAVKVQSVITYNKDNGEKASDEGGNGVTFTNDAADSSSLTVSKKVKGNASNKNDEFTFTIEVTGIDGVYTTTVGDKTLVAENGKGSVEVTLKHGQSITINNLPVGAAYTVTEADENGYQTTEYVVTTDSTAADKESGKVAAGTIGKGTNSVAYTNTKTITTPTGVFMDIMPYIVLFGAAIIACAVFFASRRRRSF